MAPSRKPVRQRDDPPYEKLVQWRAELGEWAFKLERGTGGYWYAIHSSGLPTFTDRVAERTYHLAMAWAADSCGAYGEGAIHSQEASKLKADDITGGVQ